MNLPFQRFTVKIKNRKEGIQGSQFKKKKRKEKDQNKYGALTSIQILIKVTSQFSCLS